MRINGSKSKKYIAEFKIGVNGYVRILFRISGNCTKVLGSFKRAGFGA